jgi:predicted hydrocarbon binding protein
MDAETILRILSTRQRGRFLEGRHRTRETLGSRVHLYTFQERILGALALSPSMGPVLYEAGKKAGALFAQDAKRWAANQLGYRALADAKNAQEANLSGEIKVFQGVYKSNGVGLINVVEYQKNKSILVEVRECADCFDVDIIGKAVCYSIGGYIAGSLEVWLGRELGFLESKCVAKGDSLCEFRFNFLEEK